MSVRLSTRLSQDARKIAQILLSSDAVLVASHIDADGISAAAIATSALDRAGIAHDVRFLKKLDERAISELMTESRDRIVWLTDLGSGYASMFSGSNIIITDHHQPDEYSRNDERSGQTTLFSYDRVVHLNPHFFGYSGARDISGAGLAFIVAIEMSKENRDLVNLSVLGAIGDMQDSDARRLIGLNAQIVDMGVTLNRMKRANDLRLFGTETRNLPKLLEYATDPILPGLTGDWSACEEFFRSLKIRTMVNGDQRHWSDLSPSEKNRVIRALQRCILENDGDEEEVARLTGEIYTFEGETKGSPTREAREFSTLLNSCGRNGVPELGLEICRGDRERALERAFQVLREHRENISKSLIFVREIGVTALGKIQHFHCADQVKDTLLGAIVGIVLNSGEIERSKPLIGFVLSREDSGEYMVKVSARATRELVGRGLNLATAISRAAESVGGIGGGHNVAAGATLPLGTEEKFLSEMNRIVGSQLGS